MANILLIEDEIVFAKILARHFEKKGHMVEVAHDGLAGFNAAVRLQPDVVIVDFQLPGMNGLEIIRALRKFDDPPAIVMVTGQASVTLAVDAMKAGSLDLLTKPVTLTNLQEVVSRALLVRGERRALDYYRHRDARNASLDALIGTSPSMQRLRDMILAIAGGEPTDQSAAAPILVLGETGTGKELVARACHQCSARAAAPFIDINCAALPAHLIEGELFGYEKGAFTDARDRKIGLIEAADGGTLFLDEVGELDLLMQAKLLRVLENFRVRRLGALSDRQVNVRLIAATNRDLDELVKAGRFRADLMYRLKVFQLHIAPLRERASDIPDLARHFLTQLAGRYGRTELAMDEPAFSALIAHDWPGNVRELRNVLERAVLLRRVGTLGVDDLLLGVGRAGGAHKTPSPATAEGQSLEALERSHLQHALDQSAGNVTQAARLLGISRDTLRYRMDRHGLSARASVPQGQAD